MYSLNIPVPPVARRIAADLAPELVAFRTVRKRPTLVVKRFGAGGDDGNAGEESPRGGRNAEGGDSLDRLREQLRPTLAGVSPFEARVAGIDTFDDPPNGDSPVVYLVIEGEGLEDVHERVVSDFGAVEGLEGDEYDPHVTLARGVGTDRDAVEDALGRLREREFDDVSWTVNELGIWTREYREFAARFPLQ